MVLRCIRELRGPGRRVLELRAGELQGRALALLPDEAAAAVAASRTAELLGGEL